jgi:hypothetical protein
LTSIAKQLNLGTAGSPTNLLRREETNQKYVDVRDPFKAKALSK